MKKSWLVILVVFTALSLTTVGWSQAQTDAGKPQTTCPVLGGNINKSIYTDYQGKRVYFCCTGCIAEFNKNPGKYLPKLEAQGVKMAPDSGK
jgi:YHS domain-containing protein